MSSNRDFGAFFRARRKALGLSQSEFCRRNGLDKGNISRLERGHVPPPQDAQLLESYAKALKLESGTAERERFFDLAAAATGRIPADLLEDQPTMRKLPGLLRTARARGQRHATDVQALDLQRWADEWDARAKLPQLVRKLVRVTGKVLERVEFPAHEGVQRPGWDGIVEAREADEFVPAGISGWEMGVEKNPRNKAEKDFDNRTKNPGSLDKKQTTFVFVTPRKWQDKDQWRRDKQALGEWKEVRVYDSASLEEWLEQAPVPSVWLARELDRKPPGVNVVEDYWADLQAMTVPSLKPEVFLASRDEQVKKLGQWLDGPPGAKKIAGRSPAEAIDFVVAFSRGPSRAEWFDARALIVEDRNAWRMFASSGAGLMLIAHPLLQLEPELVAEAVRHGHHVLLPSSLTSRESDAINLPGARPHDLEKALILSGLKLERARRSAREAGGSIAVLKRLLGCLPGTTHPEWSEPSEARSLVPLLLAGNWDENSEADRSALEALSGQAYHDVEGIAERWRTAPDAPVMRVGSRWSLVSRDDSWHFLARAVSRQFRGGFVQVAMKALAEDDPTYEVPLVQRWPARLHQDAPRFSQALRAGLAETLAILGTRPRRLDEIPELSSWGHVVEQIVQELLKDRDWIRWASLSDQLPLLAEAAPDAFLEAVSRDLERPEPALVKLFDQESNVLLALNPHVGLLSALEVLAWSKGYLADVSLILATLDEKARRVSSGNNAMRSLLSIFLPWMPQTTATVENRIRILKMLVERWPNAAWRLLIGLLPNQQNTSTSIHRPLWCDWALGWTEFVDNADYWKQVKACTGLLLEQLGNDISRWIDLIECFENLPGPVQEEFLNRLKDLSERFHDEEGRRELADALREKVSCHRCFSQDKLAIPEKVLSELEDVQRRFEPDDPVRRDAWLFGSGWELHATLEDGEERLQELQRSAVLEILGQRGWPGIQALVQAVEIPEVVGAALAEIDPGEGEARILPVMLVSSDEKLARFARAYTWRHFQKAGLDWVDRFSMDDWSAEGVARFLVVLPFERSTWELADRKGKDVAAWYWASVTPDPFSSAGNPDEVGYAIRMFLDHQNPSAALRFVRMALQQKTAPEPSLLMDVLKATKGEPSRREGAKYAIRLLFERLQEGASHNDPRIDLKRLENLEWDYLDLLDGPAASATTLHRRLRDEPEFFVEILGRAYPSTMNPGSGSKMVVDDQEEQTLRADRLLRTWQTAPGERGGQAVDERALLGWITKARSLAKQRGLIRVCDSRIGEVLAHAPEEVDGSWPCIPVREALEEISTDEVFQGMSVRVAGKVGGAQKRDLASKYLAFAEASQDDWPKTAAALSHIARSYEEEARREDERAMLD